MKSLLILLSLLFTLVLASCDIKEGTIVYDIEFPRADSPEAQPIPPVVSLQTSSSNLAENAGTVLVNITLNKTISSTTTVTLSLSGSATLNRDYRIDSTTLQIPAGSLSASTTLRSIDDSTDDDAETIILDIVSVSGGEGVAEAGTQQDIVTITDDEGTPAVTLSTSTYSFSENTTNPAVTLTVAMTIAATDNTTIQLSTSGTATGGGTDYSLTNSTLVIPAGSDNATTTITTNDDPYYDNGETIIVEISSVSGSTAAESGNQSETITINDDEARPTVSLTVGADNITEATGTGDNTTVTATLSYANSSAVLVSLSLSGSATQGIGNDYTIDNTTIEIPAGSLNANTTLRSEDDLIDDDAESIIIDISSVSGGDSAAENAIQQKTVTIIDNDTASISLSKNTATVSENGTIADSFSVVLTSEPISTVTLTLSGDTTEVQYPSSLSFGPGNWSVSQTITLTGKDDNVSDDNQTTLLTLTLSSGDSKYDNSSLSPKTVTVTTTDNDTADFTLSKSLATVSETGTTDTLTVVLTSEPTADVTLTLSDNDSDSSEVLYSPSSLVFGSGNWSVSQTITLTGKDDNVSDDNQTTLLTLTLSSGDSKYDNSSLSPKTVTVTTTDNDTADFTLSKSLATVSETGTTDTLTVVLTSEPTGDVTLSVTDNDTSEVSYSPSSLVFSTGNWSTAQTITLTGLDDNIVDDNQTTLLTLNPSTSADSNYSGLSTQTVTVTTTDNDTSEITMDNVTVSEGAGVATMTLRLSNPVSSAVTVSLTANKSLRTADNGTDFLEVLGKTLVIPALATVLQDNITIYQDSVVEDNETFMVSLDFPTSHASVTVGGSVEVTITDDDGPAFVTMADLTVSEDNASAELILTLDKAVQGGFDVDLRISGAGGVGDNATNGGTDYNVTDPTTVSFSGSAPNETKKVSLNLNNDSVVESNETITFYLDNLSNTTAPVTITDTSTVTIIDNDVSEVSIANATPTSITEGGSVTLTVTVNPPPTSITNVILSATTDNASASDYTLSSDNLSFAIGQASENVTINLTDDNFDENNETVTVRISSTSASPTNPTIDGANDNVTVTIIDNDTARFTVSPTSLSVNEEGPTSSTFDVSLNSELEGSDVVVFDISPSNTSEFTISLPSLSFNNTYGVNQSQTITVTAVDDSNDDDNITSTISVSISGSTTAEEYLGQSSQVVNVTTIDDDDLGATLTLTADPDSLSNSLQWSWSNDNFTPDNYTLYWDNDSDVNQNDNKIYLDNETDNNPRLPRLKYFHGALTAGTTYTYQLVGENSSGDKIFSNSVSVVPLPLECSSSQSYTSTKDTDSDLILYYPFEDFGQGVFADYSPYNPSIHTSGHPYDLAQKGNLGVADGCAFGTALYLDGDRGIIGTGGKNDGSWGYNNDFNEDNVSIPDNWTLSMWFNPDGDLEKNSAIFSNGDENDENHFQIDLNNQSPRKIGMDGGDQLDNNITESEADAQYKAKNNEWSMSRSSDNLSTEIGNWYHVVVTKNSASKVVFYFNGEEIASQSSWDTWWGTTKDGETEYTGIKVGLNRSGQMNWKGYIDEIKLYKRTFSPADVYATYSASLPPSVANVEVDNSESNLSDNNIRIKWDALPGVDNYTIFRRSSSNSSETNYINFDVINLADTEIDQIVGVQAGCNSGECRYDDSGPTTSDPSATLDSSLYYYYRVAAVTSVGTGKVNPGKYNPDGSLKSVNGTRPK